MSKSNSVGTKLNIGTGVSAKTVGGLTSINGIEISAETIDVTDLANATGYREKLPGFKEVGADEGQAEMYSLLNSQNDSSFEIVFPAKIGKKWSFSGYVAGFTTSADVGDAITFEATIIVTGQAVLEGSLSAG